MKNILITGGGTGGHLCIAKSIKDELNQRGIKPIFVGSTYGQDREWFLNDTGFQKTYFLDTHGVVNQRFFGKIISLYKIFIASIKCFFIIKKHKINTVFSVGGYSSAPASFAAILLRKNLYIHEQNSRIGRLNKLLKPYVTDFFDSFGKNNIPYPVQKKFFETKRVRNKIKTILFIGGSAGSHAINMFAKDIALYLKEKDIFIIHQCGRYDYDELKVFYNKNDIKADLFIFSSKLYEKMQKADFAISRSGASALWELVANALPTLFIPYPYAASNHQYYNAKFLHDLGLGFIINEDKLKQENIRYFIDLDYTTISKNLMEMISPDGSRIIADKILQ